MVLQDALSSDQFSSEGIRLAISPDTFEQQKMIATGGFTIIWLLEKIVHLKKLLLLSKL